MSTDIGIFLKPEESTIEKISLSDILADYDFNCRETITEYSVTELKESIRINGLLQPLIVKKLSNSDKINLSTDKNYYLVAGFRRLKALTLLEMYDVHCNVIHKPLTDTDMLCLNLLENGQRAQLSYLEEARVVGKLCNKGLTMKEVEHKIGKLHGWVQTRFYLYLMPEHIQKLIDTGVLKISQVRYLYSVLKKDGTAAVLAYANDMIKAHKETGDALALKPIENKYNKLDKNKPKKRNHTEISALLDHWYENFVNQGVSAGVPAAILAWTLGNISSNELFSKLYEYSTEVGIDYIIPDKEITGRVFGGY